MQARHEILALRSANEILAAKVSVVEVFAAALGLRHTGGGMSPDIAWELERQIDALNLEPPPNPVRKGK
jgi:hypothetical protein